MYDYRKLSREEQRELVEERRRRGLPLHEPPHYPEGTKPYVITATCFEHQNLLEPEPRRLEYEDKLLLALARIPESIVQAWVILPDHYHIVASVDLALLGPVLARLHNGTSTQWNREDSTPGRRVWYRYSDRRIRDDQHYWMSINYVHLNPVKHGHVTDALEWAASSLSSWVDQHGEKALLDLQEQYPIKKKDWEWDT